MADDTKEAPNITKPGNPKAKIRKSQENTNDEKIGNTKNGFKKQKTVTEKQINEVVEREHENKTKKFPRGDKVLKSKDEKKNDKNEENEEEDSEEEETEMTMEEKEELHDAVLKGDYMRVNNSLDKKNGDINMTWYGENLLMTAIRAGQIDMAEFLIDVGIDYNFKAKFYNVKERDKKGKRIDCYEKSCRDLAFDLECDHIVEVIDVKTNNIFPFVPITPRKIWERRPQAPLLPNHLRPLAEQSDEEEEEETSDCEESEKLYTGEIESSHPSARSIEKTNDDSSFLEMFEKMNGYGKDNGYGTMSPSCSPYLTNGPPERPRLLYRPTKASMAIQNYNDKIYHRHRVSKSAPPMRSIEVIGSYAHEKKLWEHRFNSNNARDTSTELSLPFFKTQTSPTSSRISSAASRRSIKISPLAEVTKILEQSQLLQKESAKCSHSTQNGRHYIPSLKINQYLKERPKTVFCRLSNTNEKKGCKNFNVNRENVRQYRR